MGGWGSWSGRALLVGFSVGLALGRPAPAAAPVGEIELARAMLRSGQPRRAAMILAPVVAEHPGLPLPRQRLLQAMAASGVCDDAQGHLVALETQGADDAPAHLAAGRCAESIGAWDEALGAYRGAMDRSLDGADGALALADLGLRLGDLARAREGVDALGRAGRVGSLALLRARWAVRLGSPLAEEAVFLLPVSEARVLLEAQGDALHGDCDALVALTSTRRDDVQHLAKVGECLRRIGRADDAWELLAPEVLGAKAQDPLVSVVRARAAVDLGEVGVASRLLDGLDEREVEALASRGYLAYAEGGPAVEAALARWQAHPLLRGRDPRALLPGP